MEKPKSKWKKPEKKDDTHRFQSSNTEWLGSSGLGGAVTPRRKSKVLETWVATDEGIKEISSKSPVRTREAEDHSSSVPTKVTGEEKQQEGVGKGLNDAIKMVEEQQERVGGNVVEIHGEQTSVANKPEEQLKGGVEEGHSHKKQTKGSAGEKHGQQLDPDHKLPKNEGWIG